MDTTMLVCVIINIIIVIFLWIYFSNKSSSSNTSQLEIENEELKKKLAETVKKVLDDSELEGKIEKIESKYQTLLKEANNQCEQLDKQLQNAIDGKLYDTVKEQLAQTEKLKKKIEDLEKEIEDNEDDISNLKKKVRLKDDDIAELQNNLSKEKKNATSLRDELSSVCQSLDDKVEELKLKMGSLDFIQEILSAKEISTEDTRKLYKRIDAFESFVKGSYTDLNTFLFKSYEMSWNDYKGDKALDAKKQYIMDSCDQWTATKRKCWLDGKTTIAFVGEFSAGKTSIVNRILSQDNPNIPKLPVSTKATTAIPTYIAGGLAVSYSFISGDGKRKEILEGTFKKVSKEILDQVKGVSSLIKYFVMTYKNPNLKGLSILDTPGFNSNDSEDRERTIDIINECDALFWVFDVNAGTVNRSSISIIKEKLNKPLYVVINKVDTKSESEIQKVEKLIKKTLADEGLKVEQFVRFSAKTPIEDIMNPIHNVKKIKSREAFMSDVKEDLDELSSIFIGLVDEGQKKYNKLYYDGDNLIEEINESINLLRQNCEQLCDIPRWETHLFGSDRFEMSKDEYNDFVGLIDQISIDRLNEVIHKVSDRIDKASDIQQEWSDLCDIKSAWQNINDCLEQYKKVTKEM